MTSLLAEYRERHGIRCVLPLDEGCCFFDFHKKPAVIVLTSSHSRTNTVCRNCLQPGNGLVTELFVHSKLHYPEPTWKLVKHEHLLSPDVDLRDWVNKNLTDIHEPYIPDSFTEVECWLWRFFIKHHPMFVRKWNNKDETLKTIEQMSWVTDPKNKQQHNLFEDFYRKLYCPFVVARKYILFG